MAASAVQTDFINETKTWDYSKSYKLNQLEPYNLRDPIDFYDGPVYMRYECLDKPGENESYKTSVQMCCWIGGASNEGCTVDLQYWKKGVYFYKFPSRSNWILSKLSGNIPWTGKMTVGLPHKYQNKGNGWLATGCSYCCDAKGGCTKEILDKYYIPTKYNAHVIMVKPGDELVPPAGWENCPSEWPGCGTAVTIDMGNGWHYALDIKAAPAAKYNPENGTIAISGLASTTSANTVRIFDARGKMVAAANAKANTNGKLSVSLDSNTSLKSGAGMYVVQVGEQAIRLGFVR
jgi:hypothetical protein